MITVLIVDDEALVRSGLRAILEAAPDLVVTGEAVDGREALTAVRQHDPDVVLMDIQMPVLDGIAATSRLVKEGARARILMLTMFGLDEYVYHALSAGATGFMLKTEPPSRIIDAVRVVAAGDALLGAATTRRLVERFVARPDPRRARAATTDLTEREREVLLRVARGESNAEIAAALVVGEGTVKTHVSHLLNKLGLRDRTQLVVFAYENGLVSPGSVRETPPTR